MKLRTGRYVGRLTEIVSASVCLFIIVSLFLFLFFKQSIKILEPSKPQKLGAKQQMSVLCCIGMRVCFVS